MKKTVLLLISLLSLSNMIAQESEKENKNASIGFNIQSLFNEDKYDNAVPSFIFYYKIKSMTLRISTDFYYDYTEINNVNEFIFTEDYYFGEDKYIENKYNIGLSIGIQKDINLTDNIKFVYGSDVGYRNRLHDEKLFNWANEAVVEITETINSTELKPFVGISYSPHKNITILLESFYIFQASYQTNYLLNHRSSSFLPSYLPKTRGTKILIPSLPSTSFFIIYTF
ncbi:MAG: hypothetical protein KAI79_18410 [Bacteroidales bacterium]|nr:hypothetical protein [Bacteroidales bacterium]